MSVRCAMISRINGIKIGGEALKKWKEIKICLIHFTLGLNVLYPMLPESNWCICFREASKCAPECAGKFLLFIDLECHTENCLLFLSSNSFFFFTLNGNKRKNRNLMISKDPRQWQTHILARRTLVSILALLLLADVSAGARWVELMGWAASRGWD